MKRILLLVIALLLGGLLSGVPHFGSAQVTTPWSTFHGNPSRNGFTGAAGPNANPAVTNQWQLPKGTGSSPAVDASGVAYIGDDDGSVYALSPKKPDAPLWSYTTQGAVDSSPSLSPDGSVVYVGSADTNIYAFDAATGRRLWYQGVGAAVHGSPLVSPDGSFLYIANANGSLYVLKAADGSPVGKPITLGTTVLGSLALSPDGFSLLVATYNAYMYAIDVGSAQGFGSVQTTYYLDSGATSSPAVGGYDQPYVTTSRGNLEAFQAGSTDNPKVFHAPGSATIRTTPAVGNGLVIVGASDGNLYALKQGTLDVAWTAHTGGPINSSAAIGSNNLVYVGSDDGYVYAFNLTDGKLQWQLSAGAPISSSPAIGPDGTLWVATQAGLVLRIKQTAPTNTPTATSTPVPARTATPLPTGTSVPTSTALPTSTAVPTSTATPVAPRFRLLSVRIQRGRRADFRDNVRSIGSARVHSSFTIGIYVNVTQLPGPRTVKFTWVITRNGRFMSQRTRSLDLTPAHLGKHWSSWQRTFDTVGTWRINGSASLAGSKQTKVATLKVSR